MNTLLPSDQFTPHQKDPVHSPVLTLLVRSLVSPTLEHLPHLTLTLLTLTLVDHKQLVCRVSLRVGLSVSF